MLMLMMSIDIGQYIIQMIVLIRQIQNNEQILFIMASELYKVCQDAEYGNYFRNYFALDSTDNIIVQFLTPVSLLCAGLNIYFFFKFPNARQPPFDILLIITLLSIMNSGVYLSTVIYNGINPITLASQQVPQSFSNFCSVTGTMHFICQLGVTVYNTIFCLYYTCKIKNPLKSYVRDNKEVHALCFVIVVIGTIVVYVSNQIGVSVLGICGLKVAKSSVFVQLGILFVYLFVLVTTSVFFLKYLNRVGKFDTKARMFFKYYLLYTLFVSIIYALQCTVMILIIVDCFTGLSQGTYSAFAKTGNILTLITPIVATIVIAFHPQFGRKFLPQICKSCLQKPQAQAMSPFYDNLLTTTNRKSLDNSFMIQLPEMSTQNNGYLSSIKQFNRLSLLSTVLGCISLFASRRENNIGFKKKERSDSKGVRKEGVRVEGRTMFGTQEQIYSWNFSDQERIKIDEEIVGENKEYFVENVPTAMVDFVSHSPTLFQYLKDVDGMDFVQHSTNPNRNLQKIYKNASADGGSSGQFFFFTHDNRILLKTITSKQLTVLLQRLQAYYYHFLHNPHSLIVKIYGVYSVVNPETGEQIHFMMMGNLCEDINKKYVLRIFDCKGSTHHRQVFKESKQQQQPQYTKKTMKDVDFDRLEHKVWLKKQQSQQIRQTLKEDSSFFQTNGLIDYSLIIIKVDYNAYCLDMEGRKPSFNERTMFFNEKQPNMIYILGIIDYLETWNARKKGERWYKSLFARSDTISSQSPTFYRQRFCENLIQKIFK